jgi:hypothetical protein
MNLSLSPLQSSAAVSGLATDAAITGAVSAAGGDAPDFSAVLREALTATATEQVLSAAGGGAAAGAYTAGSLESVMLAAAASGQTSDAQSALFMLLMMMGSMGENSEIAPLLSMMATMVGGLQPSSQKTVYADTMNSGYDRSDLLDLESGVFLGLPAAQSAAQGVNGAVVPVAAWQSATPALTGDESNRSPETLKAIIGQFDVENAERYRPFRNGVTYCNIFLWDVTSALGCEIPHYIDDETGAPRSYPDVSGAWEMNANATADWLARDGAAYGWTEATAEQAQAAANAGRPAVTAWKNTAGGSGHVQVVTPSEDGGFDAARGVTVAQAGAQVTEYTHITDTFKRADLPRVKYYIHA